MKHIKPLLILALSAVATFAVAAVAQEHPTKEHPAQEQPSAVMRTGDDVLAVAAADGRFKHFVAAVEAAGLAEKLQAEGPFTVFAPTDEAFAKLPEGVLDDLMKPANRARLAGLLADHVVPGKLLAANLITMKATNVAGRDLGIAVVGDLITVADAKVVGSELLAGNGVIHAIDSVIMLPDPARLPEQSKPKDHPAH